MASLRGGEDDQPALIDTTEVRRLSQKGKAVKPAQKAGEAKTGKGAKGEKPVVGIKAAAQPITKASPASATAAKQAPKEKPRMRLVNGKMVPVEDGPKLF